MLQWDPRKRPTCKQALKLDTFDDARIRFHTCMCSCVGCPRATPNQDQKMAWAEQQMHQQQIQMIAKQNPEYFEPLPKSTFNFDHYLSTLLTVEHVRYGLATWIKSQPCGKRLPLCINLQSPTFQQFKKSSVAQSNELPPSPAKWK